MTTIKSKIIRGQVQNKNTRTRKIYDEVLVINFGNKLLVIIYGYGKAWE